MPAIRAQSLCSMSLQCALCALIIGTTALQLAGCKTRKDLRPDPNGFRSLPASNTKVLPPTQFADAGVVPVNHEKPWDSPPPRMRDINDLEPWPMSLDDAVRIALKNSNVIRSAGGRILATPDATRTTLDSAVMATDPNAGEHAALSAFDTQFESGLLWNGGGRSVGTAFTSGNLGVFSQPTTLAKLGLGRTFTTGTRIDFGGFGGYDSTLAAGPYAGFGVTLRQPLMRKAGKEFNSIAGPHGRPGAYHGVWIAQINADQVKLELEEAVRDLVRDVCRTYWELYFAYQNMNTKRVALEHARQSWQRELRRVAEQVSPRDFEALARQQFYTADAAFQNAISGTGRGATGVYDVETKLRTLLALPMVDGRLIRPTAQPLTAWFQFDWSETLQLAHSRRIELRKQQVNQQKRELELRVAHNLRRPQLDLVGQYRRLADEPDDQNSLFAEALQGWRIGVEFRKTLGNRLERATVRNAELRLSREHVLLEEQQRQVTAELRTAFTELDRAFGVTQALAASRDAARVRLHAEAERHAAGETQIERVLESQTRATQADTDYQRSLVDYNLAFVQVHLARGTLLETVGVGFSSQAREEEMPFAQNRPSIFTANQSQTVNRSRDAMIR